MGLIYNNFFVIIHIVRKYCYSINFSGTLRLNKKTYVAVFIVGPHRA